MAASTKAAKIKAAKTRKGYRELGSMVGTSPPVALNGLSAAELKQLGELVEQSLSQHEVSLDDAEQSVVRMAPRPLRGTVRRLLGVKS